MKYKIILANTNQIFLNDIKQIVTEMTNYSIASAIDRLSLISKNTALKEWETQWQNIETDLHKLFIGHHQCYEATIFWKAYFDAKVNGVNSDYLVLSNRPVTDVRDSSIDHIFLKVYKNNTAPVIIEPTYRQILLKSYGIWLSPKLEFLEELKQLVFVENPPIFVGTFGELIEIENQAKAIVRKAYATPVEHELLYRVFEKSAYLNTRTAWFNKKCSILY